MIAFNHWPSCLIRRQIRAEWTPATRSCTITNYETRDPRFLSISYFVTDVILLSIMLAGVLRLRRGGGSFYLSHILWKQVGVAGSS